jgi:tetratricopeptide (TPR) repeat protein
MNAVRTLIFGFCLIGAILGGWTQQSRAEQVQWKSSGCRQSADTTANLDVESQAYGLLQSAKRKYIGWNEDCTVRISGQGSYWEAFQDLEKAIDLNPNLAKDYYARGLLREREFEKPEKALEDYNKALELDLSLVNAYYARGLLKLSGDRNSAAADFQAVIKIDPISPWGYYGLGLVSGNIADFDRAIHLNPQFAAAYYQRGLIKEKQQNEQAAMADYQKAITLNPGHSDAQHSLVILRLKTRQSLQTNSHDYLDASRTSRNGPSTRIQETVKLFEEL